MQNASKQCTVCKQTKPHSEFNKNRYTKCGLQSYCRLCDRDRKRDYRALHPDETHKYQKKYSTQNKDRIWKYSLNRLYGPGAVEHYNKKFQEQCGHCAVCGVHQDELPKRLELDHNHLTGQLRGLVCHSCNCALGLLKMDIGVGAAQSAVDYIQHYYAEIT